MQRGLIGFVNSLSLRLLSRLLGTILVVFAAFAFISYRNTSARWTEATNAYAAGTGDLIKRATRHGMMGNRKDDLHETIRMIAQSPQFRGIRIYDKSGTIIFSNNEEETGRKVDLQAEACVVCHDSDKPLQAVPASSRWRVYYNSQGERLLGLINPIENEPACSTADCHAHSPEQSVLGVLDVRISMRPVEEALEATEREVIWLSVVLALLVGVGVVASVYRLVRRPIWRLYEGTQRIAQGDLSARIEVDTRDEVGRLAAAFNGMAADLQKAYGELTGWSRKLEQEVEAKTEELGHIQRQIVHMEKMASLGKLSATVAHELNNPLAGILTYSKLIGRTIGDPEIGEEDKAEVQRWLSLIQKESFRCGEIVKNLLLFARQSGAKFAQAHLNEVMQRSLMLVGHHLQISGVELEYRPVEGDDQLLCDPDQVQQALLALLVNAVEAMQGGGRLVVSTDEEPEHLRIRIRDTGSGIPDDVLPHIFEPFFSTKNSESGVGLGLAVVYGIVQRHGGRIDVNTGRGQGTTFIVELPRNPPVRGGGERPAA